MAITPTGKTFEVFGSLAKSALTESWWSDHQGAVVFPTDENKVYFAGKAYDGMSSEQLRTILNSTYGITPSDNHTRPTSDPAKTNGYYTVAEIQYLLTKYQTVLTQAANAGRGINIETVNGQPKISINIKKGDGINITDDTGANSTEKTISLDTTNNTGITTALGNNITSSDSSITTGMSTGKFNIQISSAIQNRLTEAVTDINNIKTNKQDQIVEGNGISVGTDKKTVSVKIDTSVDNSGLNVGKNGLSLARIENTAFGAALAKHLTAGDGISISQSGKKIQISTNLDLSLYTIVNELPTSNILENKIYLVVNAETGTNNTYKEYIYVDNNWELLGEYKAEVDLSNYVEFDDLENELAEYYTKSEADDKFTLSGTTISGTKTEVKDNVISAAIIIQ